MANCSRRLLRWLSSRACPGLELPALVTMTEDRHEHPIARRRQQRRMWPAAWACMPGMTCLMGARGERDAAVAWALANRLALASCCSGMLACVWRRSWRQLR